jgi:LPXTG-site transpeptidase (sortase) family protein
MAPGAEAPGEHEGVVLAYRDDPGAVYDRPIVVTPAPTPVPEATPLPGWALGAPAPPRESRYRMVIDSIGVDAGVFTYGLDANAVPEVPLNGWDVAWYNFSAPPGTGSNAVFAGHVTWNGRAVFWDLPTLAVGDQVRLIANDGSELVYAVTDSYLIDPNAPDAIQVMLGTEEDVMTIITCDGDPFFIGGSFGYDYTHRRVIRAALVNVHPAVVAEPAAAAPEPAQPAAVEPAVEAPAETPATAAGG